MEWSGYASCYTAFRLPPVDIKTCLFLTYFVVVFLIIVSMQLISFSQEFVSFVSDDFDPPFVLTKDA